MALAKTGGGITDIRGKIAGNVFTRDKAGLHIQAQKRAIRSRTPAQRIQRNAFAQARRFCEIQGCISKNIYHILNGLPLEHIHD